MNLWKETTSSCAMHSRAVKCWPILDFYWEQSMSHYPREILQFRAISHMDELHNLDFLGLTAGSSDPYPTVTTLHFRIKLPT